MFYDVREPRDRIVISTCALIVSTYACRTICVSGASSYDRASGHTSAMTFGAKRYYLTRGQGSAVLAVSLLALMSFAVILASAGQLAFRWWRTVNRRDIF